MRSRVIIFGVLLVVAHVLTESAEVVEKLWPKSKGIAFDSFINYDWSWPDRPMMLNWWIKYNTEEFLWCATFFVLAMIGRMVSYRFFLMGMVFFIYHIIDWFMLWYDYKQSHLMYWTGCVCLVAVLFVWLWPEKGEGRVVPLDRNP